MEYKNMNSDPRKLNAEPNFDRLVEDKLGSHVYVLTDPTDKKKATNPFILVKEEEMEKATTA
jgi:hypothetical protein